MEAFQYTALNTAGQTKKGVLEGDSSRQVRQQLRQQGLTPLEVIPVLSKQQGTLKPVRRGRKVSVADLSLLTRQLATLLGAGMPVEEALQGVSEQVEKSHVKSVILGVRAKVLEGHSLATGMRYFPRAFPNLYCATVGAGEQTGKLDVILERLADYTEQQQQMRQKIQQALIYPSLMTLVSIGIVTFLLIFVVPKIIAVFSSTGQKLPDVTLLLIGISQNVKRFGLYLLILLVASIIGFAQLLKRPTFKRRIHSGLLRLPIVGYMIKTINTARYARTLGILSSAGVPLLEAMRVSSTLITNLPMQQAIDAAGDRVREGSNLHYALKQTGYFSPMMIHLVASGEQSGRLEAMLTRAADHQDNEVTRLIETGLTLFEPLIILLMGAVVLFIVLAILLPIFQMDQFTG